MDNVSETEKKTMRDHDISEIRARCGFLCSQCRAYKGNILGNNDQNKVSEMWKKIYGLDIPGEVICCDGCLKPDNENPHRIGENCPIRTCVLEKNIEHCGLCKIYPCDLIEKHLSSVETVLTDNTKSYSKEEVSDYIEPYLCRKFFENNKV